MRPFALSFLALGLGGVACAAALDAASAKAVGDWRLSEVGGKIACTLTLTDQSNFAGFEVKAPLACRHAFPALKTVAAWMMDGKGGIVLADAHALHIVTFPVQTGGPYEAKAPDGQTWRLELVKPDGPPSTTQPAEKPPAAD